MWFSDFPSVGSVSNRFLHYRLTMETDNNTLQPDFTSTTVFRGCYPGSRTFTPSGTRALPGGGGGCYCLGGICDLLQLRPVELAVQQVLYA